jgi:hypothetical protein
MMQMLCHYYIYYLTTFVTREQINNTYKILCNEFDEKKWNELHTYIFIIVIGRSIIVN